MIERQITARFVNAVINHETVRPWIAGPLDGYLDLSGLIESRALIALFGIHGGFLFYPIGRGIYDAHSAVLPAGRGRWALRAAREALDWIFNHEAEEVMMSVPHGNDAVRGLVRLLKAKRRGTIEDGWWLAGRLVSIDVYSVLKDEWQCPSPLH